MGEIGSSSFLIARSDRMPLGLAIPNMTGGKANKSPQPLAEVGVERKLARQGKRGPLVVRGRQLSCSRGRSGVTEAPNRLISTYSACLFRAGR